MENETVTLALHEYDRLRSIESEFNILKNTPEKFIKIQIPSYNHHGNKDKYEELRILSGIESVDMLTRKFKFDLEDLEKKYKEKINKADRLERKYSSLSIHISDFMDKYNGD